MEIVFIFIWGGRKTKGGCGLWEEACSIGTFLKLNSRTSSVSSVMIF